MSVNPNLTDEQRDVLAKVEKLLRLAGGTKSESEASSATSKAMDLLAAYNLDVSSVGTGDSDGKRSEEKLEGGFYDWERDLWRWVAELNFCICWHQRQFVDRPEALRKNLTEEQLRYWSTRKRLTMVTKLVGRTVNVTATKVMVDYLLQAVERLTREFVAGDLGLKADAEGKVVGLGMSVRNSRAMSFRKGVVERVIDKIYERRQELLREEERERREAESKAAQAGMAGAGSSSTALTLSSLRQSERDANEDFLYGEGWSARQRAERQARAEAKRKADEEYTAWALANPDLAKKQEEERRKAARKTRYSGGSGSRGGKARGEPTDWAAFRAGHRAGDSVSIDLQAEAKKKAGLPGH